VGGDPPIALKAWNATMRQLQLQDRSEMLPAVTHSPSHFARTLLSNKIDHCPLTHQLTPMEHKALMHHNPLFRGRNPYWVTTPEAGLGKDMR